MAVKATKPQNEPDIFEYLSYREFLLDWVEFQKSFNAQFSIRKLSKMAGLSVGFLNQNIVSNWGWTIILLTLLSFPRHVEKTSVKKRCRS